MTQAPLFKFLPLWAYSVFFRFSSLLHFSLLPILGERVFSPAVVGIIIGSMSFLQLFLDLPTGFFIDREGYKKSLKYAVFFFLIATGVLFFGVTKLTFLLTALISGLGWVLADQGKSGYVLDSAPYKRAGTFISVVGIFTAVGGTIATVLVVSLASQSAVFIATIITLPFVIAGYFLSTLPEKHLKPSIKEVSAENISPSFLLKRSWRKIQSLHPYSTLTIVNEISSSLFASMLWFVVPLMIANSATAMEGRLLGIGLSIFDFMGMAAGYFFGRMADTFNKKLLILLAMVVGAIGAFGLSFTAGLLFIFFSILGAGSETLSDISVRALLSQKNFGKGNTGAITGVLSFAGDVSWGVGPILAGVLYGMIGPQLTLFFGATMLSVGYLSCICLMVAPLLLKRRKSLKV